MRSYPLAQAASSNGLESWNHSILSFDLDELETAAADPARLDQQISLSLAALFDEQSPVQYEPCDQFHCQGYY